MKYLVPFFFLLLWVYAIVRAETAWKWVPIGVGPVIGVVCAVEDFILPLIPAK